MNRWRQQRWRRGFTLVELMIAMALMGMLTAVIYGLFVHTSDSLSDVEGHTAALDQARFGIEQMRMGLLAAGSQSTPNSSVDPWVAGQQQGITSQPEIYGVIQDSSWRDQSLNDVGFEGNGNNPGAGFDSVVVVGAFDVPANLFVSFPDDLSTDDPEVVIEGTERGLHRAVGYDPFDTSIVNDVDPPDDLADRATQRLLRIKDSEGFSQIQPITGAEVGPSEDLGGAGGAGLVGGQAMKLDVPQLHFRDGDEPAGFNASTESDVSFDAAMIDAYWYYVRAANDDPMNLQLVRQRLDATELIDEMDSLDESDLADHRVDPPMVLAERVVDFRVWFDCRGDDAAISDRTWEDEWEINVDGDRDCVEQGAPQEAQIAHARLSTRTESENPNRPHYDLVDDPGAGFESEQGQMRTFELYPEAEGSAGVVTTQTSVELTNFAMRDYTDGV